MNVPDLHEVHDLTVQPVQYQFLIKCHQPLWLKHKSKILHWDWSSNMYVRGKPKASAISKIRCKAVCKYLLQCDQLVMKQGVLHQIYTTNAVE